MMTPRAIWGFHMPARFGRAPIDQGFIALGWDELGDLTALPPSREGFKAAVERAGIAKKPGAIPVWAGLLYRYVHEMREGDLVIYPSKTDRMLNLGIVSGPCRHDPAAPEFRNRRSVDWRRSLPRASFSQSALHEIGSALTLFQVTSHSEEFLAALEGRQTAPEDVDDSDVEEVSAQVEESTEDFILRRLKAGQSPYEFEHFLAHLLTCMGYFARVTQASGDAGVDVIAHRDELGFEPPIIKVQCKQTLEVIGRPAVQQLHGAIEHGEHGLFVTLGRFSPDARNFERSKPNLRLVDGEALIGLIYNHYHRFDPRYQRLIPLKRIYVPGGAATGLEA